MCEFEYRTLYSSLKDIDRRELKKMLFDFGIRMTCKCKKDDYIRELIHCLDNLYTENEETYLPFD